MLKKVKKGFTLVELLVVVAIIAILAAIAIPAYNSYRDNAMQKAAVADARQCLTAIAAYLAQEVSYTYSGAPVPTGCTAASATSCSCTKNGKTATCTVDSGGSVTCS